MTLLSEITLLLLAAAIGALFGKVSRIGAVLAFVTAGILIGPSVLGLVSSADDIPAVCKLSAFFCGAHCGSQVFFLG
jgi:Kef-type K+ transport system membrane component KefB